MRIPLANIPCAGGTGFTPADGMNMPWCVWMNTVDSGARGQVLITGCADNNASGAGQETKLLAVNPNRWSRPNTWGQIRLSSTTLTGVGGNGLVPLVYEMAQNFPNPFNPTTTINFILGKASNVKLTVFNLLGQNVATILDNQMMNAGKQSVVFDARNLSSGVYFYRLDAGNFSSTKKMLLMK
jgi:hypothetical protein